MGENQALESWLQAIEKEEMAALATILPSKVAIQHGLQGARFFINKAGQEGKLDYPGLEIQVMQIMKEKFREKGPKPETRTITLEDKQEISIFFDIYIPPLEIMIFGAGHDAVPLAKYCVSLGYRTTIIDGRKHYNNEEHFPGTKRIFARETEFDNVHISERTYVIVMNHHIEKDEQTIAFVLKSDAPYVGVLGPRSRRERMMERLGKEGITFRKEELLKMHSPVGLDIGARSPEEIAISILAEIIALKNGHVAGFLKGAETIH